MKILLTLIREGGTKVEMADRTIIHFKPNDKGHNVAEVTNPAHIKRLLSIDGYHVYKGTDEVAEKEITQAPLVPGDTSEPIIDMVDENDPDFDNDDELGEANDAPQGGSGEDSSVSATDEKLSQASEAGSVPAGADAATDNAEPSKAEEPANTLTPAEKRKATMAAKAAGTNNKPASTAAKKNPALGKK